MTTSAPTAPAKPDLRPTSLPADSPDPDASPCPPWCWAADGEEPHSINV